jgi:hypothetical protein
MVIQHPDQLTLFKGDSFIQPKWPTKGTIADQALQLMLDGASLDHPTFEAITGSWRLAAVVFELRAMGWPVTSEDQPNLSARERVRMVAAYRLDMRQLAELCGIRGGAKA